MSMKLTETHERILILLISLHSFIVGIMLLFFAEWAVGFAGWSGADPIFFIWQAGAFHYRVGGRLSCRVLQVPFDLPAPDRQDDRLRLPPRRLADRGDPVVGLVLRRGRWRHGAHRLPRPPRSTTQPASRIGGERPPRPSCSCRETQWQRSEPGQRQVQRTAAKIREQKSVFSDSDSCVSGIEDGHVTPQDGSLRTLPGTGPFETAAVALESGFQRRQIRSPRQRADGAWFVPRRFAERSQSIFLASREAIRPASAVKTASADVDTGHTHAGRLRHSELALVFNVGCAGHSMAGDRACAEVGLKSCDLGPCWMRDVAMEIPNSEFRIQNSSSSSSPPTSS